MEAVSLSIVIASHNASGVIATCLQALEAQTADPPLEVIVADCSTDSTPELITRQFPTVRLLSFAGPLSLAMLRGHGIAAARGTVVAILDPFSVAASDWASQVLAAHARHPNRVIGGSVDLFRAESASYSTWTTYLNEYALFMPPVVQGETWILPGSNVSYKRSALFDGDRARYPLFWKTFVNWEQEAGGSPMWLEPAVRVALNKPVDFPDFARTRYLHGRCFAGMRVRDVSWPVKLARAGSAILLPLLQSWRWTAGFWPKRRYRGRFFATLPAQFLLFVLWSAGEACGYLRGTGRACERTYY
jgi:glycosyltransferase involved in cell wall biosynthesis